MEMRKIFHSPLANHFSPVRQSSQLKKGHHRLAAVDAPTWMMFNPE